MIRQEQALDNIRRTIRDVAVRHRYHAVMESGVFVVVDRPLGLLADVEYQAGKRIGPKCFSYVGFSFDYLHFNVAGECEQFVVELRQALELPRL